MANTPKCPKCGKDDALSSVELMTVHYGIVVAPETSSGFEYTDIFEDFGDTAVHDDTFNCGHCCADFQWSPNGAEG